MNKITVKETKKELKETTPVEPGQIYRMTNQPSRFFMVVDLYDGYSLIELSDGVAWDTFEESIDNVFASQEDLFELVKNVELNIIL